MGRTATVIAMVITMAGGYALVRCFALFVSTQVFHTTLAQGCPHP